MVRARHGSLGDILRYLRRESRGTAIIEFALVAAPLIALILAITETALVFFAQQALETGVEAAARTIITGQTQLSDATGSSSGMTAAQLQERFRTATCAALPPFLNCSGVMVDVQSYSTFSQVSTTLPTITYNSNGAVSNSWNYNLGGAGSIVIVRLMYIWPVPAGPLGFSLSNMGGNNRLLMSTSVAKSEAYS